ncbi:MAG: membrane protein insertase YidC [Clostridiales bacterium]|nr:membrane protein insertase YidC [Clostridiales bacterium]
MTFFLTRWFYWLMQFLYGLFNNSYLLTILVVTVLLRLVQIFPDISNRKTQIKMAVVQPKLNELQKRYENDPQKLRVEQQKLMKEHGVSTLSSCLPMLITLPLFFCFLAAFRCWGNEETVKLMYETAVAETCTVETEREAADETAMDTFKSYKFLWVNNVWQPDNFIDANVLIFRMDGEVITKPRNLTALSSVSLANMPMLQNGYTDANGNRISGETIWAKLKETGLAAGEYGDAGAKTGCNSCSSCATDRSGMNLLPDEVDAEAALKIMGENAEGTGTDNAVTGSDIYTKIMKRYPDALAKDGKIPANGLMILPFLAAGMQLVSSLILMKRQKKDGSGQNQNNKSMNYMMYLMPVMSILICMSSTAAFAFYWTVSGAVQIVSSLIINAVFDKKAKKDAEVKAA